MHNEPLYFIASSRVYEALGKLDRWSIIDLYREGHVFPSVAESVLQNLRPNLVAREVGRTPPNRWGATHPIYQFLDEEKRAVVYSLRFHSRCRTACISEAMFTDDFCEVPSGFSIPHNTDSLWGEHENKSALIRFEKEWLSKSRTQFARATLCGMYEDSDKAEQVFEWYKMVYETLFVLWEYEIESARLSSMKLSELSCVKLPDSYTRFLTGAVGGLLLSGAHHVEPVRRALERWYRSPLLHDVSKIALPTLE